MKTFIISLFTLAATTSLAQTDVNDCDPLNDSVFTHASVDVWVDEFKRKFNIADYMVSFNKDSLTALYNHVGATSHVRIYFTIDSEVNFSLPGAVLIPFSKTECSLNLNDMVLTADRLGVPGQLGPLSTQTETEINNWKIIGDIPLMNDLVTVYAYNFTWDHIMTATNNASLPLTVVYGISDINDSPDTGDAIHMYLTNQNPLSTSTNFLDFSRPCPQLCGNLMEDE